MLFADAPINVSAAIAQPNFVLNTNMPVSASAMFSYGASRFVVGVRADGSGKPGIAESTDNGMTWATKDQSYAGLTIAALDSIHGATNGSTVYLAIAHGSSGTTIRVLTFDMASGAYTSTSPDLVGASGYDNGHGLACSNGDYCYFSRQSGHPVMNRLSSGAWSSDVVLDAIHDAGLSYPLAASVEDRSGDVHLYYGRAEPVFALDYVKISGLSASGPVTVKSGAQFIYDVVIYSGKQYLAWGTGFFPSPMWIIESDSDTNPAVWSDVLIDSTNVGGVGNASMSDASLFVDGATVNLFYSAIKATTPRAQQIWYSQLVSGAWSTPVLAYDAALNPPSTQAFATQNLSGIDVCRTGTAAYACAMNAINATGGTNVYFMSASAVTRRSYAF